MMVLSWTVMALCVPMVVGQSNDNLWEDDSWMTDYQDHVFQEGTVTCGTRPYDTSEVYSQSLRSVQTEASSVHIQSRQNRVVGGSEAEHGEIPWQASVKVLQFINDRGQRTHICGAVIISEYWLLSAAHCFQDLMTRRVVVGEHYVHREDEGEQEFEVEVFNHEKYHYGNFDYDIALLKIKPANGAGGIQFNDFVQPICLPDSTKYLPDGSPLLVSGWGGILPCRHCKEEPQVPSNVLLKAVLPLVNQEECKQIYHDDLTDNMFCAGYEAGRISACNGDSGGPIVSKTEDRYVLQGLVSWSGGCAQPNKPGVYVRVSAFLPWIESTVNSNS